MTTQIQLYQSNPGAQDAFMLSEAEEVMYGGAASGGKSMALRMWAVNYCLTHPGAVIAFFRRTYKELEDTHIRAIQLEVPVSVGRYKTGPHNFEFYNGSVILFRYCELEDDVYSYDTSEWDAILLDELTAFSEFQYDYLCTRVRSPKPWWPGPRVRSGTMPGNVGHDWVKRRFIDYAKPYEIKPAPEEEGGMTRQFIPALPEDNPTLARVDPNYIERLKRLPPEMYAARALGVWSVSSDHFFGQFRPAIHEVPAFPIPPDWPRYMSVDYGSGAPYCVLWAAHPPSTANHIWFYREHYGAHVPLSSQVLHARQAMEAAQEHVEWCVLDPSMFNRTNVRGVVASPLSDDWVRNLPAHLCRRVLRGNNERISGWATVNKWLEYEPDPSAPFTPLVQPRLHIMTGCCPNLSKQLAVAKRDRNHVEDLDTGQEDHALDALRYHLVQFSGLTSLRQSATRYIEGPRGLVAVRS